MYAGWGGDELACGEGGVCDGAGRGGSRARWDRRGGVGVPGLWGVRVAAGAGWGRATGSGAPEAAVVGQPRARRRVLEEREPTRVGRIRLFASALRLASHFLSDAWLSADGLPARMLSTLTSSSRSGQWMPTPPPINRQLRRSRGLPWSRRGYQVRGAVTVRPSRSSTTTASLRIRARTADGTRASAVEVRMPCPLKNVPTIHHELVEPR